MKYLFALIADFSFEEARRKTDSLYGVLRTYFNRDLTEIEKIGIFSATLAFLVQTLCKRVSTSSKDEDKLIGETLAGLKQSIESNGGKKEFIDFVSEIMDKAKKRLIEQKENNLPKFYISSLIIMNIDESIATNYINELIMGIETLNTNIDKVRNEIPS